MVDRRMAACPTADDYRSSLRSVATTHKWVAFLDLPLSPQCCLRRPVANMRAAVTVYGLVNGIHNRGDIMGVPQVRVFSPSCKSSSEPPVWGSSLYLAATRDLRSGHLGIAW
ncbi:MAG: hypothetical protein QOJ06_143 [Pseudonocardiales bacterium]|jgi:hypothetical protein|nr:hypothetical protein [Pseudonocardiales bacterium]